jgi:hypothetical protein
VGRCGWPGWNGTWTRWRAWRGLSLPAECRSSSRRTAAKSSSGRLTSASLENLATGMHPLAKATALRVAVKIPRFDVLEAFDHLRRLDDLARLIDSPPLADRAALLDAPVMVGDVEFYRLSYAASELIGERFSVFQGRVYDMAVAWASAHARDPDAIRTMFGLPAAGARREILDWARGIRASYAAVIEAVRELVGTGDPADEKAPEIGFGSIVSVLISEYGQDAEYWIFAPIEEINQRLVDRAIRNDIERREIAAASKQAVAPDPDSYSARAQIRFNKAAQEFEAWALKRWPA